MPLRSPRSAVMEETLVTARIELVLTRDELIGRLDNAAPAARLDESAESWLKSAPPQYAGSSSSLHERLRGPVVADFVEEVRQKPRLSLV